MSGVTDRLRNCCDQCAQSKIKCDSKRPSCANCARRDRTCTYSYVRQSGRPRHVRPTQGNTAHSQKSNGSDRGARHVSSNRQRRASAAIALCSSPPQTVVAFSSQYSYDQVEPVPDAEESLHYNCHDCCNSFPQGSLDLENATADFSDSLALETMQHFTPTDYLAEPDMSMDFNFSNHCQANVESSPSLEQCLTLDDPSPPFQPPPADGSQLEQGLHGLLDDSRISTIVDGMINSPIKDKCIACAAELRDQCFHAGPYDDSGPDMCRCPTMLNKLYLVVMDPKLSPSGRPVPLDLILFLEQALQNTIEAIKQCTVCGSSTLSSNSGITLCIAANWITNSIQVALECEIEVFTRNKTPYSPWGRPERNATDAGADATATILDPPPPSQDARNSLRIGSWSASSKDWVLCVSEILAARIKRMQHTLSGLEGGIATAENVNNVTTERIKNEMARDIQAKAKMLLGMVKIWVSEYIMGY